MAREALLQQAKAKRDREGLLAEARTKRDTDAAAQAPEGGPGLAEKIETGARSALEGATLGVTEPVISGANAVIGNLIDAGFDSEDVKDFLSRAVDTQRIKKSYGADVERRRQLEAELPGVAIGSEIAGAIAPALLTGGAAPALAGAAKVARVGVGVGKAGAALGRGAAEAIPGVKAAIGAKGLIGAGARTGVAAAEGAGAVLAAEGVKRAIETPTGFIRPEDEQPGLGELAAGGAKFGAAFRAAPELVAGAARAGKSLLSATGGVKTATIEKYLQRGTAVRDAKSVPDAKEIVDQAVSKIQQQTQGMRADLADNVVTAVGALKQKVIDGSAEAYEILEGASKRDVVSGGIRKGTEKIVTANIKRAITESKKELLVGGTAVGPSAKQAISALDDLREDINKLPAEITLAEAKRLLQTLDKSISYARGAGDFGDEASNAMKSVRRGLDEQVKSKVPEYREKMEEVSGLVRQLEDAADSFGDRDKVFGMIDKLQGGKGMLEAQRLKALGATTGTKLPGQLGAITERQPIMGMAPATTESLIKSVMNGNSIENRKKLQLLSKLSDQDLVVMVENTGIASAFTGEFRAGSANVNLWTVLGGAGLGAFAGDQTFGSGGAVAGAILGSMVRTHGPAATRRVLDGMSRIKGAPTLKKIDQVMREVPEAVKQDLKLQLIRATQIGEQTSPVFVPEEHRATTIIDIQGSGLSNTAKAKAINSLNRTGEVSSETMNQVVTGGQKEPEPQPQIGNPERKPVSPVRLEEVTDFIRKKRKGEF